MAAISTAELISDITSSGQTLKANKLRILSDGEILKSQACLMISKLSTKKKGIKEINSGIYIFKISQLFKNLKEIRSNNESNEYYLTDVIELINKNGIVDTKQVENSSEVIGINSIEQLESFKQWNIFLIQLLLF